MTNEAEGGGGFQRGMRPEARARDGGCTYARLLPEIEDCNQSLGGEVVSAPLTDRRLHQCHILSVRSSEFRTRHDSARAMTLNCPQRSSKRSILRRVPL